MLILGRAAGLPALALATLASGPCGPVCSNEGGGDECATISDLVATRDAGLAKAGSESSGGTSAGGSAGTAGAPSSNVEIAQSWHGVGCPTALQYAAIVELKFPGRYAGHSVAKKDLDNDQCCYSISPLSFCDEGDGRPFLVQGERRVASVFGADQADAAPGEWLASARLEHASVAAFARLTLQLMSLGAPAELLRDVQLAALDELRHADFFFELASRQAGQRLEPGALDVAGALDDFSLAGLIESNLLEGCIGETLAAEQLRERAARSSDAALQAELLQIADDETRHAALAFRILRWCRERAPELTRAVLSRVLEGTDPERRQNQVWQHVLAPLLSAFATA